jgi:hypothetical protein
MSSLELMVFEIDCSVTDFIGEMTSDMGDIYLASLFPNFDNCGLFMLNLMQNNVFCTRANERGLNVDGRYRGIHTKIEFDRRRWFPFSSENL